MHPIERLRYVARSVRARTRPSWCGRPPARWPAWGSTRPGLVTACRRIVERHPTSGPLWWLCARTLTAADPLAEAWRCVDAIEEDTTADELAMALPDDATVCVVGWPDLVAQALLRRGDVDVLAVDGQAMGHGLARRLRRLDVEVEEVGAGGLAAAAGHRRPGAARGRGHRPGRLRRPGGDATPRPRSGYCAEVPVWLVGGVGRLLPERLWQSVVTRLADAGEPWELDHDVAPLSLASALCGPLGPEPVADGLRRLDCPVAPELLRTSPF